MKVPLYSLNPKLPSSTCMKSVRNIVKNDGDGALSLSLLLALSLALSLPRVRARSLSSDTLSSHTLSSYTLSHTLSLTDSFKHTHTHTRAARRGDDEATPLHVAVMVQDLDLVSTSQSSLHSQK